MMFHVAWDAPASVASDRVQKWQLTKETFTTNRPLWMSSDVQANAAVSKDAVASLQSFHSASPVLWI